MGGFFAARKKRIAFFWGGRYNEEDYGKEEPATECPTDHQLSLGRFVVHLCHSGREKVCKDLSYLGAYLDPRKNLGKEDGYISTDESRVKIWRLKTDEESVVAACVREFLQAGTV